MEIQKYYYNDEYRILYIDLIEGDEDYSIELDYNEILIYSPQIIMEDDLLEIDEEFVREIVEEYYKKNN